MRPWVSTAASGSTSPSHAARATPGTSAAWPTGTPVPWP
jgi:Glycoside hydrolase 97